MAIQSRKRVSRLFLLHPGEARAPFMDSGTGAAHGRSGSPRTKPDTGPTRPFVRTPTTKVCTIKPETWFARIRRARRDSHSTGRFECLKTRSEERRVGKECR